MRPLCRSGLVLAALVFPVRSAFPQEPRPPAQEPPTQKELPTPVKQYGAAQPEELQAVAYNPDNFQRRNIVVRGHLAFLPGDYWELEDTGARLLLIPALGLSSESLHELLGHRVEVTGIVRVLPAKQGTCRLEGQVVPESKCDDPYLPALPDRRPEWPPGSLTATRVVDLDVDRERGGRRRPTASMSDLLAEAATHPGRSLQVVGQFRGANLFGDLPADSRRAAGDWVLKNGEHAVWVTGRPPRGKGFDLDPGNKSDTGRWLEVQGKIEVVDDVVYLKASRIQLVARPAAPPDDKP